MLQNAKSPECAMADKMNDIATQSVCSALGHDQFMLCQCLSTQDKSRETWTSCKIYKFPHFVWQSYEAVKYWSTDRQPKYFTCDPTKLILIDVNGNNRLLIGDNIVSHL